MKDGNGSEKLFMLEDVIKYINSSSTFPDEKEEIERRDQDTSWATKLISLSRKKEERDEKDKGIRFRRSLKAYAAVEIPISEATEMLDKKLHFKAPLYEAILNDAYPQQESIDNGKSVERLKFYNLLNKIEPEYIIFVAMGLKAEIVLEVQNICDSVCDNMELFGFLVAHSEIPELQNIELILQLAKIQGDHHPLGIDFELIRTLTALLNAGVSLSEGIVVIQETNADRYYEVVQQLLGIPLDLQDKKHEQDVILRLLLSQSTVGLIYSDLPRPHELVQINPAAINHMNTLEVWRVLDSSMDIEPSMHLEFSKSLETSFRDNILKVEDIKKVREIYFSCLASQFERERTAFSSFENAKQQAKQIVIKVLSERTITLNLLKFDFKNLLNIPEKQRLDVLKAKDEHGSSILNETWNEIREGDGAPLLYHILCHVPKGERNAALCQDVLVDGETIALKKAILNSSDEKFSFVLKLLPENELIDLVIAHPREILAIFGLRLEESDIGIVSEFLNTHTAIQQSNGFENFEAIIAVLKSYQEDQRLIILKTLLLIFDNTKEILFQALTIKKELQESYPSVGWNGYCLASPYFSANLDVIGKFLQLFPHEQYMDILKLKMRDIYYYDKNPHCGKYPPFICQWIECLNITDIDESDFDWNNITYIDLKHELVDNLIDVLYKIPSELRLGMYMIQDEDGEPLIHRIINTGISKLLSTIFNIASTLGPGGESQLPELLEIQDSKGISVLDKISNISQYERTEVISDLISYYPKEKLFQLLKTKTSSGYIIDLSPDKIYYFEDSFVPDFILVYNFLKKNAVSTAACSFHHDQPFASFNNQFQNAQSFEEAKEAVVGFLTKNKEHVLASKLLDVLLGNETNKSIETLSERWRSESDSHINSNDGI